MSTRPGPKKPRSRIRKPRPPRPPDPLKVAFEAMPADEQRAVLARLQDLLESQEWRFAKTMASNPHWYTLRNTWANDDDFIWVVEHIRALGYRAKWTSPKSGKSTWYIQIDLGPFFYWSLGWPVGDLSWGWKRLQAAGTILVNRKPLEPTS